MGTLRARTVLVGLVIGALAAACGSSPTPNPSPTPGATTTWVAARMTPKIVCDPNTSQSWHAAANGSQVPDTITLTCDGAVAAAEAVVAPTPMTSLIEFSFGKWCPQQGAPCGPPPPANAGYVVFRNCVGRLCRADDLVVVVTADDAGRVAASAPQVAPKPTSGP